MSEATEEADTLRGDGPRDPDPGRGDVPAMPRPRLGLLEDDDDGAKPDPLGRGIRLPLLFGVPCAAIFPEGEVHRVAIEV